MKKTYYIQPWDAHIVAGHPQPIEEWSHYTEVTCEPSDLRKEVKKWVEDNFDPDIFKTDGFSDDQWHVLVDAFELDENGDYDLYDPAIRDMHISIQNPYILDFEDLNDPQKEIVEKLAKLGEVADYDNPALFEAAEELPEEWCEFRRPYQADYWVVNLSKYGEIAYQNR